MDRLRIDKWLWAARFYKTRSLATEEIDKGRVAVNGQEVKPAREVKVGDTVSLRREGHDAHGRGQGPVRRAGPGARGPAAVRGDAGKPAGARTAPRSSDASRREPALSIEHGRPTKRGRRELDDAQRQGWGDRWSASIDDEGPHKR